MNVIGTKACPGLRSGMNGSRHRIRHSGDGVPRTPIIAADHRGFRLKEHIANRVNLAAEGWRRKATR